MIGFDFDGSRVFLLYSTDTRPISWIDEKLEVNGSVSVSKVFTVRQQDVVQFTDDPQDDDVRRFEIGRLSDDYIMIRSDVLGLKHDLLISESVPLERRTFVAERNISIFRRIDELIDEQIVVGGARSGAIPEDQFARLLRLFPTSTHLNRYAAARVSHVIREHLDTMTDAEQAFSNYVDREQIRLRQRLDAPIPDDQTRRDRGRIPVATELEMAKFTYVRDRLTEMLREADSYAESEWQLAVADLFLLVYPQYVTVLHDVHVKEYYSKPGKATTRKIDLVLMRADGFLDIIEIKRPFENILMSRRKYRDNHVPMRVLSGTIMQAEKYLFYLSKAGVSGENAIAKRHAAELPNGVGPRIANPRAIILAGRDHDLSQQQLSDLEVVRRTHSNVVDVVSYDDLLRRLNNVIASLETRIRSNHGLEEAAENSSAHHQGS